MKKLIFILCLFFSIISNAEEGKVVYIDVTIIEEQDRLSKIPTAAPGIAIGFLTAYLLPQFNTISRIGIGTAAGIIGGYAIHEVVEVNRTDTRIPAYMITIETDERIVCVTQKELNGLQIGSRVMLNGDKIYGRL